MWGAYIGSMTAKFRVGDWVRISSTLTSGDLREIGINGNIDEYVGKVDKVEYDGGEYYRLENCGMWFSEDMLEKADEEEDFDRYVITLERFGADGKFISGQVDISRGEYEELWKKYVEV